MNVRITRIISSLKILNGRMVFYEVEYFPFFFTIPATPNDMKGNCIDFLKAFDLTENSKCVFSKTTTSDGNS